MIVLPMTDEKSSSVVAVNVTDLTTPPIFSSVNEALAPVIVRSFVCPPCVIGDTFFPV